MNLPGETEAGSAGRQPCRGITGRLIEPMFSGAGANPLALCIARKKPSDARPRCLEKSAPLRGGNYSNGERRFSISG